MAIYKVPKEKRSMLGDLFFFLFIIFLICGTLTLEKTSSRRSINQRAIAQGIRNDVNAPSERGYYSSQAPQSTLPSSLVLTRKYNDTSTDANATVASFSCLYLFTVEVLLFAVGIVRKEKGGVCAKVVDKWEKMAPSLKNLLQGHKAFSVVEFLESTVVQEGGASSGFFWQLEKSKNYSNMSSSLMHIPHEGQAKDEIAWTWRDAFIAFLEWSVSQGNNGLRNLYNDTLQGSRLTFVY